MHLKKYSQKDKGNQIKHKAKTLMNKFDLVGKTSDT